ncbi:MAG: hypothetical protein KDA45_06180, partial [Planctomycetales bacterium]|nr:hypothetical protein [Planctomycetales bacterium]
MLRYCLPSLVLFALLGTALAATARAQLATPATEVTRFDEIEDVIRAWRPERHVFVKGDIGVGTRQLQELQRWISDHAPHWTVVLMEHAAGESFRAADGRTYRGMDAVEYALGYGLSNRTDFGRLEHPQTKESDGAVFALFLRERKFSYFASDAQDRRGLGEANWIGQLDQPAFRAMRNGGRILDAAKSTIETIDEQLARAIQSEVDAEQRANAERVRAAARLARAITAARQRIAEVRMAAANFRLQHPTASGPLARPAWERWEETLAALESEATPDTARALLQRLSQVNDDIQRHLNGYASAQALADQAQRLAEQGELLRRSPAQVAAAQLSSAESWW